MKNKIEIEFSEKKEEISFEELKDLIIERLKRVSMGVSKLKGLSFYENLDDHIKIKKWVAHTLYEFEIIFINGKISGFSLIHNNYNDDVRIKEFNLGFIYYNGSFIYGFVLNNNIILRIYHDEIEKFFNERFDVKPKSGVITVFDNIKRLTKDLPNFTEKLFEELPVHIKDRT